MKVFASSDYYQRFIGPLCDSHPQIIAGQSEIKRFPNGEMQAIVQEAVDHETCLVIGSVAPPDEQLLALLSLIEALKRQGAATVHALLPYLGYARQDKFSPGESGGIALIGSLLKAVGVDQVITFDAHSELDKSLIGVPLTSLSSAPLFTPAIQEFGWDNLTIVAPDEGAVVRAQSVADGSANTNSVAYLVKKRSNGIMHLSVVGKVGQKVVLVDDIIDSGQTLISACDTLQQAGVKEMAITVTHGLFTGADWQRLFGLGVKTLLVSDSCPEAMAQRHPNIKIISLNLLLPAAVEAVTTKEAS